jgi:hypothetical protein
MIMELKKRPVPARAVELLEKIIILLLNDHLHFTTKFCSVSLTDMFWLVKCSECIHTDWSAPQARLIS